MYQQNSGCVALGEGDGMGGVDTEYVVASACSGMEGGVIQAYVG